MIERKNAINHFHLDKKNDFFFVHIKSIKLSEVIHFRCHELETMQTFSK